MEHQLDDYWKHLDGEANSNVDFLRKNWFDAWRELDLAGHGWDNAIQYENIGAADGDCAIIPYVFQKIGPLKFASLPGMYFPHRGIPNTKSTTSLIDDAARKLNEISGIFGFRMGPVESSDIFISELTAELKRQKWKIISLNLGSNYGMVPPESVEQYLSQFSRNRRQKMRSHARKMDNLGTVELKHFNGENDETWQQVFKDIETVESNAWVSKSGEPRFIDKDKQAYWNKLIQDDWFKKAISVWILYLDDKPVSKKVALDAGGIRYYLTSSYDECVAQFNTGVRLEVEYVSDAIAKGIKYINNGLGDSGYKAAWGSEYYNDLLDVVAFPPTLKGKFAYLLARLKLALGR